MLVELNEGLTDQERSEQQQLVPFSATSPEVAKYATGTLPNRRFPTALRTGRTGRPSFALAELKPYSEGGGVINLKINVVC